MVTKNFILLHGLLGLSKITLCRIPLETGRIITGNFPKIKIEEHPNTIRTPDMRRVSSLKCLVMIALNVGYSSLKGGPNSQRLHIWIV